MPVTQLMKGLNVTMSLHCEFALVSNKGKLEQPIADAIGVSIYQSTVFKGMNICVPKEAAISSGEMPLVCILDALYIVGSEDSGFLCQIYKSKRCLFSVLTDVTGQIPTEELTSFYTYLIGICSPSLRKSIDKAEGGGCSNVFELLSRIGFEVDNGLSYKRILAEHDLYESYELCKARASSESTNYVRGSEIQAFGTMFLLKADVEIDKLVHSISLDAIRKDSTVDIAELLNHDTNSIGFINLNGHTIGYDIIGFEKCSDDWIEKLSCIGTLYIFIFNKYDREACLTIYRKEAHECFYFKKGILEEYDCIDVEHSLLDKLPESDRYMPKILDYLDANIFTRQEPIKFVEYCY